MKRLFIAILSLFVLILSVFSSGFVFYRSIGNISLLYEGEEVLNEEMSISVEKYLEINIFYKGSIINHYRKGSKGSPMDYLRSLNSDMSCKIDNLKQKLDVKKQEPYYEYKGDGEFAYYEGVNGIEIDINALALSILRNINSNTVISVPYKNLVVKTTYADLVSRSQNLATFSTSYSTSSSGRKTNIMLSTNRLNGTSILPGETLSFNDVVGERTIENGFLMAKIIQNGEFIEGVGGGVCQTSTTLFNACLLAGLEIDKSSTHSLPVSYVSPSLDAMVSSSSDLIIKNTLPYPVFIYGHCDGKKLTFEVFGYSCGYKIKLRYSILRELICNEYEIIACEPIPDGMEFDVIVEKAPKNGLVSESYRDYYNDEGLVYTERLRRSVYAPQKGLKYKTLRID